MTPAIIFPLKPMLKPTCILGKQSFNNQFFDNLDFVLVQFGPLANKNTPFQQGKCTFKKSYGPLSVTIARRHHCPTETLQPALAVVKLLPENQYSIDLKKITWNVYSIDHIFKSYQYIYKPQLFTVQYHPVNIRLLFTSCR